MLSIIEVNRILENVNLFLLKVSIYKSQRSLIKNHKPADIMQLQIKRKYQLWNFLIHIQKLIVRADLKHLRLLNQLNHYRKDLIRKNRMKSAKDPLFSQEDKIDFNLNLHKAY
jgi:hypothetical protein